jgi:hypothetical protein
VTARNVRRLLAASTLVVAVGLPACGSDSSSGSTTAEEEETGESYVVVPDSQVTAGLGELSTMGAAVAASITAGNDATSDVDEMFEKWASFEGTIKQNEVEMYLTFEDTLANFRTAAKDKDAAAAAKAVETLDTTSAAYLAKHP